MKRIQWMLSIAFAVLPTACVVQSADEDAGGSAEAITVTGSQPIYDNGVLTAHRLVNDPFENAEVSEDASSVTVYDVKVPCRMLNNKRASFSTDGPDGGTCTITGTTVNCTASGKDCICQIEGETKSGDCASDGSKTTFSDPPQTQGMGL